MVVLASSTPVQTISSIRFPTHRHPKIASLPFRTPRCLLSVAAPAPTKPSPAEASRTIMELCSVGTLSTLTHQGWPLGTGVRFVVDHLGTPILCFHSKTSENMADHKTSLHVQLHQNGSRTPQCTLIGKLKKPDDKLLLRKLSDAWAKRFGDVIDQTILQVVDVERVYQIDNFGENGTWFSFVEYVNASPDPLRDCARAIVSEINDNHMEDVHRFCNVFVDIRCQVTDAKIVWIDRLGFDVHLRIQNDLYDTRIPFPREVTDERNVKSTFNCMSQLSWEVEKNYTTLDFEKVKVSKLTSQVGMIILVFSSLKKLIYLCI